MVPRRLGLIVTVDPGKELRHPPYAGRQLYVMPLFCMLDRSCNSCNFVEIFGAHGRCRVDSMIMFNALLASCKCHLLCWYSPVNK